jgi:hypothetical protein
MEEENCVMDVETMYNLHKNDPNIHSLRYMVVNRNGMPMRNDSSAIARFNIYLFVTVCILENLSTT